MSVYVSVYVSVILYLNLFLILCVSVFLILSSRLPAATRHTRHAAA